MGQGAPFPFSELAGTPYRWSNASHCSGDSLMSFTFIGSLQGWCGLGSMPEQAVKTVLKKAVRARAVELGKRLFSAKQIGERTCARALTSRVASTDLGRVPVHPTRDGLEQRKVRLYRRTSEAL